MKRFLPANFNDFFAIILVAIITTLWILEGKQIVDLRDDVNGALVVLFTLVVQFYFRTRPPTEEKKP